MTTGMVAVFAFLCGWAFAFVCFAALVLIPAPQEEHDADSLRNVATLVSHPLPSVQRREANRAAYLRQRSHRVGQVPEPEM